MHHQEVKYTVVMAFSFENDDRALPQPDLLQQPFAELGSIANVLMAKILARPWCAFWRSVAHSS
jgi:hypothetical protein